MLEYKLIKVDKIVINRKGKEKKIRIKRLVKYMNKMNMDYKERKEYRKMLERFGEI